MVVLGSTGSIGTNSLEIARKFNIEVEALACAENVKKLNAQIAEFHPKFVYIKDEKLKSKVAHNKIFSGKNGICEMLNRCESKTVINALVGFAGLIPSLKIQNSGKILCLSNKESLVVGGKFLDTSKIRAIDSEHFGLKFLLENSAKPAKMIITASGGAFYKTPIKDLSSKKAADALKHPNWNMGAKITIDSATMANKLFEMLEAFWLYGCKNLDALIEPSSSVHALIEFIDGSTAAHLSHTDMKLAIAHAILPNLKSEILKPVDLLSLNLKFEKIDIKKYPIFELKDEVLSNPDLGVIINAANEIAVFAFLQGKCGFLDISSIIFKAVEKFNDLTPENTEDLIKIDKIVRNFARSELKL